MTKRPNKKTTTSISRFKVIEWVFLNLPFVCFVVFLTTIYIWNSHSVERKLRRIEDLKSEVKDARWRYMTLEEKIMYNGTQSELEKQVADLKLKPIESAPVKIEGKERKK